MEFTVLLCLFSIHWTHVLSYPTNDDGFAPFSPMNNMVSVKQVRNKDFRDHNETEDNFYLRSLKPRYCKIRGECVPLNYTTCFGIKIPYTRTSLILVPDYTSLDEAQERLHKLRKTLINIPKCWSVVQPFLCSLFMPKCEDGQVVLPSKELCDKIQYPCRILNTANLWPPEFNCTPYKQEKCKNDMSELKFNTTSQCMPPLVRTERESSYYEGIEGCGVQCHDPFFSDEERQEINKHALVGSIVAALCNAFALVTLRLDKKSTKRFPTALAVKSMNLCSLIVSLSYMFQLWGENNDGTICRKDGTLKTSENSLSGDLYCLISFVSVYYFLIAGIVWFFLVALAFDTNLREFGRGTIADRKTKRVPIYHIAAWCVPVVCTVATLALGEVDGDSLLRVCFIGGVSKGFRLGFLLSPFLFFFACGWLLCMIGVVRLVGLKMTKERFNSQSNSVYCSHIRRVLVFSTLITIFVVITSICHIYDYLNYEEWEKSFRKFIICQLSIIDECRMETRPSLLMSELRIIALFGLHVGMASWVCNKTILKTWHKPIKKLLKKEIDETKCVTKHKIISRAYAKIKQKNSEGNCSVDMENYKDPVGLNFELNSVGSQFRSSSWMKALPMFVMRRNGLVPATSRSNSSHNRSSLDSQYSISVKRVSVESHSRRHSIESTVSLQTMELKKTVRKKRDKRRRNKKCNYKYKSAETKMSSRHGSYSSLARNLEKEVMGIFITNEQTKSAAPNMNRRFAIADIGNSTLDLLDIGQALENRSDSNESSNSSASESDFEMQPAYLPS